MFRGWRGASRRLRTSPPRSGSGSAQSFPRDCCGPCGCGRPTRTGPRSVLASDRRHRPPIEVERRYSEVDVDVLTEEEARRFAPGETADPQSDPTLAWELLYRLEPELYERLVAAEPLHPGVLAWLPGDVDRTVEVAAGTGRLTLELVERSREVLAIEPAGPLREILSQKLSHAEHGARARVVHGFFDDLPVADDYSDLVVACSALTPAP